MTRLALAVTTIALIIAGTTFRLGHWGLPLWLHHFGGGILWGAMLFTLIAALRPPAWGTVECVMAALVVVVVIEGSRLAHGPALDAFRMTLAGQLLLGRIFSPWNILADAFGVGAAACAAVRFGATTDGRLAAAATICD